MITYLSAFIFYTLAMIGILLIGFVVYKKIMPMNRNETKGMIKILDTLPIGNKKVLLVVKIKNEKFLLASGMEHTTFLSKLNDENSPSKNRNSQQATKNIDYKNTDDIQALINAQTEINQIIPNMQKIQPQQMQNEEQIDELQQARLQKLQRQFSELYNQEEIPAKVTTQIKKADKQKIIKQLLKELNTDTDFNSKIESKY